ncbi:MAG: IspD/TarI family cytidylyltransferase [Hyphomicrobiales bacterium]
MKLDAVIVAAGSSTRFGAGDKLLTDLAGRPLIAWSIAACAEAPSVERIILVGSKGNLAKLTSLGREYSAGKFAAATEGGDRRRDSVEAGVRAAMSRYVAIQDGARPLLTPELVERTVAAAEGKAGAIAAVPVVDTVKEVDGSLVTGHPERSRLWAAQTPQVVLRQAWLDAAAASDNDETDDAAMLARLGLECAVAEGDPTNLKVTRPVDLAIAEAILAWRARR